MQPDKNYIRISDPGQDSTSVPNVALIKTRVRNMILFFDQSERVVLYGFRWLSTLVAAIALIAITIYGLYELVKAMTH